jgi:hypothetical protein
MCTNRYARSVKQIFISNEKTLPTHQGELAKFNQVLPSNCFELSLCEQEGIVHKISRVANNRLNRTLRAGSFFELCTDQTFAVSSKRIAERSAG